MAEFKYIATNRQGRREEGVMKAGTAAEVEDRLKAQLLKSESIVKKGFSFADLRSGVRLKDKVIFTRQFSTLIDANIPMMQSLDILESQFTNGKMGDVIRSLKKDVESGAPLSEALTRHPTIFSNMYCSLVGASETSGMLPVILNRLAEFEESQYKTRLEVLSALSYPIVVFVISLFVVSGMLIFGVPIFKDIYGNFGSTLPWITQRVIDFSNILRSYSIFLIIFFVFFVLLIRSYLLTQNGKYNFHKFLLRAPIVGGLMTKLAVSGFTRTLATMLGANVNLLDALRVSSASANNLIVEEGLREVERRVSQGSPLAVPLADVEVFPSMVVQMVAAGENSGSLEKMLEKIADFYDDEVNQSIKSTISILEPLAMVFLVACVGMLVVALYLPMLNMGQMLQR